MIKLDITDNMEEIKNEKNKIKNEKWKMRLRMNKEENKEKK